MLPASTGVCSPKETSYFTICSPYVSIEIAVFFALPGFRSPGHTRPFGSDIPEELHFFANRLKRLHQLGHLRAAAGISPVPADLWPLWPGMDCPRPAREDRFKADAASS
jgi:hypothetical protein